VPWDVSSVVETYVKLMDVCLFPGPPIQVINTLSELGYKVVCSTGDAEVVWTLQREV
jgi:hypothetical protein